MKSFVSQQYFNKKIDDDDDDDDYNQNNNLILNHNVVEVISHQLKNRLQNADAKSMILTHSFLNIWSTYSAF